MTILPFPPTSLPADPSAAPTKPVTLVHKPVLKVLGLGGGGSNAVNRMIELGMQGVDFITANTDCQALKRSLAPVKIQLGPKLTRGLGAGGNPEVGTAAAEESYREIAAALQGADMVFLTAGMGGGTGTGSISIAAKISRALGAVTIAIVTTPFSFERGRRQSNASEGLAHLRPHTDTLITIPNDRLLQVVPHNQPLEIAFRMADDVLRQAVQGITELITETGMINVDFAHIRHVMKLGGGALMAIGQGRGINKALVAIDQAMHHPLLETASLDNAAGILVNFTSGEDLTLFELQEAVTNIKDQAGPQAEIVMGVTTDTRMLDRVQVILIITGLGAISLEDTLQGIRLPLQSSITSDEASQSEDDPRMAHATRSLEYAQPLTTAAGSDNLDLPAFMRRVR